MKADQFVHVSLCLALATATQLSHAQSAPPPTAVNLCATNPAYCPPGGVSDVSDQTQMQLQMAMAKRTQFDETITTILKKSSDTQATITGNLKP